MSEFKVGDSVVFSVGSVSDISHSAEGFTL
jgi:hypothetical protein